MRADQAIELALLSAANASIAFTVSETRLLAPLRASLKARSPRLGEWISCGYCFGHWTAAALVALSRPRLFYAWWPADFLLSILVVAWLSAFQWAVMCWLLQRSGK